MTCIRQEHHRCFHLPPFWNAGLFTFICNLLSRLQSWYLLPPVHTAAFLASWCQTDPLSCVSTTFKSKKKSVRFYLLSSFPDKLKRIQTSIRITEDSLLLILGVSLWPVTMNAVLGWRLTSWQLQLTKENHVPVQGVSNEQSNEVLE